MGRPALGEEAPGPLGTPCPHGRARGSGCGLYPGCGAACAERDAATAGDCVRGAQGLAAASDKHLITDRRRAERGARHGRTLCVTLCARPPGWALWRQGPGRPRPGVTGRGRARLEGQEGTCPLANLVALPRAGASCIRPNAPAGCSERPRQAPRPAARTPPRLLRRCDHSGRRLPSPPTRAPRP